MILESVKILQMSELPCKCVDELTTKGSTMTLYFSSVYMIIESLKIITEVGT